MTAGEPADAGGGRERVSGAGMTGIASALKAGWGVRPLCFDTWMSDPSDAPVDFPSLQALLSKLPPKCLLVREGAAAPGAEMPRIEDPGFEDLEKQLLESNWHIMSSELESFSDAWAGVLERFMVLVWQVVPPQERLHARGMIGFFLSSPGSVARFHADIGHNFLLQIFGTKQAHIFPNDEPELFSHLAREQLFAEGKHYLDYRTEFERRAHVFDLKPGMSIYTPSMSPHWVEVGPEVSLSVGLSIRTSEEDRKMLVHRMNRRLRRLGMNPGPIGARPSSDGAKCLLERTLQRARKMVSGTR